MSRKQFASETNRCPWLRRNCNEPTGVTLRHGHSTRSLDELTEILKSSAIEMLADIRSFPGSRRFTRFSPEPLRDSMTEAAIDYVDRPCSINMPSRVEAFPYCSQTG